MWSPEVDTTHIRAGNWECPFCGEQKQIIQSSDYIHRTLKASLVSHVRVNGDDAHGGAHRLPKGYTPERLDDYITSDTDPKSTLV